MTKKRKTLSNPFSTGGGGYHFEAHVQASFVTLMLTGGYAPCLPRWPIAEIKLQGRVDGFETDDLIVFVENPNTGQRGKLLGQVKHSIALTKGDSDFSEIIKAAWNDFNNPDIFTKGEDVIALITGPLNRTDSHNVQWLLNQAKIQSADTFYRNIETAKFSPTKVDNKLNAIKHHLKLANHDTDVPQDKLYSFLKHFHLLGYDVGEETGVVLSLLQSHISQFNREHPEWIWSRVVDITQTRNHGAGTITWEDLPEDLIKAFEQPDTVSIPEELTTTQTGTEQPDWNSLEHASCIALANLVGSWNGNNNFDTEILSELVGENYSDWIQKIETTLHLPASPLSLKEGRWKVMKRAELWDSLGQRISDRHLDAFKNVVLKVLTESDPSFDLPKEERYAAQIHGKVLNHSQDLRSGLAEGLAMLGNNSQVLSGCSKSKADYAAALIIKELLSEADWVLWGSLDYLLPLLSEAAPEKFLDAVEEALTSSPCPFDELFAQEGDGLTGKTYITGLLWALEGLAWDKEYLVRACAILADIASRDPGGDWANRPFNSLVTILLPWLPQTLASVEKRKVAVTTILKNHSQIGWDLVINMLPGRNRTSSGSYKPSWCDIAIPEDGKRTVSHEEYWEQVSFYAELAVSEAGYDSARLAELADNLNELPRSSFDELLEVLSSDAVLALPEDQKLYLWNHLTNVIRKHKRHPDAKWALDSESLLAVEKVTENLPPSNPFDLYRQLFSATWGNLFEEKGNLEEQERKLAERRQQAIREIFESDRIESVIRFAESVESPEQVGWALGAVADERVDMFLLPEYLGSENRKIASFVINYVLSRYSAKGWSWVDGLDRSAWTEEQTGQFLGILPFTRETWERADRWLGEKQGEYWSVANVRRYNTDEDPSCGIEKLIEHKRPRAAIYCLGSILLKGEHRLNPSLCVHALLCAPSPTEQEKIDGFYIVELIKFLQESSEVSCDDLFSIEWAYLSLLDRPHYDASPRFLEKRLADDPEFFCYIIRLLYRSKKADPEPEKPSKNAEILVNKALQLLYEWQTPPGIADGRSLDGDRFKYWLRHVKEISAESGHSGAALTYIGQVLIHCPKDADGLWIDRIAAEALNAEDAKIMRDGYEVAWANARGAYVMDPTGNEERELANKFRQKADDVENAGFWRLAASLKKLASRYDKEADRGDKWD